MNRSTFELQVLLWTAFKCGLILDLEGLEPPTGGYEPK